MIRVNPYQAAALLRAGAGGAGYAGYDDASQALGNTASGLGIYGGLQQRGLGGYGSAAANSAKLAGNLSSNPYLTKFGGNLAGGLNIINGIRQGGVSGYGQAGLGAAQLGSNLGAFSPAVGQFAGYAAIPLSIYNEAQNWQSGATANDALGGASTGAAIGTAIAPGIGTLIGAGLGAIGGGISSAFGGGKKDPETLNWNQYVQAYNQNPNSVGENPTQDLQNLAGIFDSRGGGANTMSMYRTYGRMGENKFLDAMTQQIHDAAKSGLITPGESASDVYNKVVNPWINSLGSNSYGNTSTGQATAGAMGNLLTNLTDEYMKGQTGGWRGVGGEQVTGITPYAQAVQSSGSATPAPAGPQSTQNTQQYPPDLFKQSWYGGKTTALSGGGAVRKVHFDDGGSYDWGSMDYTPTLSDPGASYFNDQPYSGYNQDMGDYESYINATNNPYAYGLGAGTSSGSASSAGGSSGGIQALLSAMGISGSKAASLAPYAALAPILGSMLGIGNQTTKQPTLPSQYSGPVLNIGTPNYTRQQNNLSGMTMDDWLHAAEGPQIQYYRNNAVPATQMSAPNIQAAQALSAASGQPFAGGYQYAPIAGGRPTVGGVSPSSANSAPTAQNMLYDIASNPQAAMAAGGPYDNPYEHAQGIQGHVQGPGDGTSDSIQLRNAYLSNGEYVVDAPTLSMLGNGSNDAGAKWMDKFRQHIRKKAGAHMAKGKQPMNVADAATAYAYGGAA